MGNVGYSELLVDLNSVCKIYDAIEEHLPEGCELQPANKVHCTLMYDQRNPDIIPSMCYDGYTAKIVDVMTLGNPGSKYYAAVLVLDCPKIKARFEQLIKEGFKHSYDDLLIHVSISYGESTVTVIEILKKLFEEGKLPETIYLCNESWNECKG